MEITSVSDVHRLPRNISPEMLDEMFGDEYEAFDYMTAADALFDVPHAVTAWLRREDNMIDWIELLAVKTFALQVHWWGERRDNGPDDPSTQTAKHRLEMMRARYEEALVLLNQRNNPRRNPVPVSRAMDRLEEQYSQEFEGYLEDQRRLHGPLDDPPTRSRAATELLKLDQARFDDVVVDDVMSRPEREGLDDFRVAGRWRDTLIRLGDDTLDLLGVPPSATHGTARFAVADSYLPLEPTDVWARRMTFLSHVQARLIECNDIRRRHKQKLSDLLFIPAEEKLRDKHYVEYVRYRVEEEAACVKGTGHIPLPYPGGFLKVRERLIDAGWDVVFVRKGDTAWLDAHRDDQWMTVKGRQRPEGSGGWKKGLSFYVRWTGFADVWCGAIEDRIMAWATSVSGRSPEEDGLLSAKRRVWDPVEHRVAPVYVTSIAPSLVSRDLPS